MEPYKLRKLLPFRPNIFKDKKGKDNIQTMFGHSSDKLYDGLLMRGHAGRPAFQESVLNILRNAGVHKARQDETKLPEG